MSNVRVPSYLLTAPRTRRPTLSTKLRRSYYDYSYGYREPRAFNLPDCECSYCHDAHQGWPLSRPFTRHIGTTQVLTTTFSDTPAQLHNRTVNAPLLRYVDSLRTHGHRAARVDPLDLLQREEVAALDPARYGLDDPARTYDINGIIWTHPIGEDAGAERWPLERIARHLREVYVGRVAYEYMHSPSKTERLWFSHLLESESEEARRVGAEQRKRIHKLLAQSEVFDQFLQLKFPNLKRYGLEGGESMLPALDALFGGAAEGPCHIGVARVPCAHISCSRRGAHYRRHATSWTTESPYGPS